MAQKEIDRIRRRIAALLAQARQIEDDNPHYNIASREVKARHKAIQDEVWGLRMVIGGAA